MREKNREIKWMRKKIVCGMLVAIFSFSLLTGCGSKPEKIADFSNYAGSVSDIEVPLDVKIVALGEATHGNNEFQQLKLDVFKQLVETTNIRAFVLEGDFGGCALINAYIQGGEGDLEDVTRLLGYRIYRTDNMKNLISWMRDYNEKAAEEDKVRIYGCDMQYDTRCIMLLKSFYEKVDANKATEYANQIDTLLGVEEDAYNPADYDKITALLDSLKSDLEQNKEAYIENASELEYDYAIREVENIGYYLQYREKKNYDGIFRDTCMAENVKWVVEKENGLHNSGILLSGHNGHITKNITNAYNKLGNLLYEEYGEKYFAIGTDYYKTTCNLPVGKERKNKKFCSDDILAYQVGEMDQNVSYLDFEKARESQELAKIIDSRIATGSLGESYSPIMKVIKNTNQIYFAPGEMYDGMIFVYEATPIEVWSEE